MLQIAIHGDDHVALGFVKSRRKRRGLSEIAAQPNHLEAAVGLHQVGQQFEAAVGGRIVDEHDFVGLSELLQHRGQAIVQRQNRRLLVVDGTTMDSMYL